MELSAQNSVFLSFLNKLDIDVKQFPERTFDGLFENMPELHNYFFNWFMDHITPDNALTQSEQATYFHLVNTKSLPSEEDVNYILSSSNPTFEELMALDVNYVNSLSEDLAALKKCFVDLSGINEKIDRHYDEVKKKENVLKQLINSKKKHLNVVKKECHDTNLSFAEKLNDVKFCLLEEPHLTINFDLYYGSLPEEGNILHKFDIGLLENLIFNFPNVDILNKLEVDLHCSQISKILTDGFVKMRRVKIDFLSKLYENISSQRSFSHNSMQPYLASNEVIDQNIIEEIKFLESELFKKWRVLTCCEVQKVSDEFLSNKLDLNLSCIKELNSFKMYIKSDVKINSCLSHILQQGIDSLEKSSILRRQLCTKLNEYKVSFSRDVINFEFRKQRFRDMRTQQNQHPLLAGKNVTHAEENTKQNEESLTEIIKLMSHGNDDSNFIPHGFRNDLQAVIKVLFKTTLCGPTSQILFVPVELLVRLHDCDHWDSKLSHLIKRLVNKYVDVKAAVSKSDRRLYLLWVDFLANPLALLAKLNQQQLHSSTR